MKLLRKKGDPDGLIASDNATTPRVVRTVPRFEPDMKSLLRLASAAEPPKRLVRSKVVLQVGFGFGYASGNGLGSIIIMDGEIV
jgi:hypothetical protein